MSPSLSEHELQQALAAVDASERPLSEKVDMLVQIAMQLQLRPRDPSQLQAAVELYDRALALLGEDAGLPRARVMARRATAMMQQPMAHGDQQQVISDLNEARQVLAEEGSTEETAECDMNLGLALQSSETPGAMQLAIQAYQRALQVFNGQAHPREYAILQSNLATAYLSVPVSGSAGKMREALAVQAFEAALGVVNMQEHPREYAMLQNNLGNALQYAASGHPLQNNLRALEAYEEALKVRSPQDTPLEYANTLANMANCLGNLPDDPDDLAANRATGNPANTERALACYRESMALFREYGEQAKVALIQEAMNGLQPDVAHG